MTVLMKGCALAKLCIRFEVQAAFLRPCRFPSPTSPHGIFLRHGRSKLATIGRLSSSPNRALALIWGWRKFFGYKVPRYRVIPNAVVVVAATTAFPQRSDARRGPKWLPGERSNKGLHPGKTGRLD